MNSIDSSNGNHSDANDAIDSLDSRSERKTVDSSFRQTLWRHYSNGFHFFGGSLFPTTTTSTTTLYNSSGRESSRNTRAVNNRRANVVENDCNSLKYQKYSSNGHRWSQSLQQFRPTDQLLKLIRRRRAIVHNNTPEGPNGVRNRSGGNGVGDDHNDDSWNPIRYHIISRPYDCQYVCYNSNLSTPLHAACLHRAPNDVILMILTAWPEATMLQDAEGWTPLHVHILYSNKRDMASGTKENFCSATATESLIRLGGAEAAAQHSKFVGSALHLACRHNVGLSVLAELLQVCPQQITIRNEAGGLPANIQWTATYKEKMRSFKESMHPFRDYQNYQSLEISEWKRIDDEVDVDLLIRLCLFLGAFRNEPILLDHAMQTMNYPLHMLHDVVAFHYECSDRSNYVGLFLKFFPSSISVKNNSGQLPLHVAVSYSIRETGNKPSLFLQGSNQSSLNENPQGQSFGSGESGTSALAAVRLGLLPYYFGPDDPLDLLLEIYPEAASEQESEFDRSPLFVALINGKRTWRTGIASLVHAAPSFLEVKDKDLNLFPFQIAATMEVCDGEDSNNPNGMDLSRLETIFRLLLACPHVMRP